MVSILLRIASAFFLLDGLLTMILGRKYLCRLRIGPPGNRFRRVVEWFIRWPGWLLRGGAALQAAAAAGTLFHRAPTQRIVLED